MNRVAIGVGSNIDPDTHIPLALEKLRGEFKLIEESEFVTTTPIGTIDQQDFRNGACLIETPLDQESLKTRLLEIEKQLGRVRTGDPNGPRTIDLDIVVWNGDIVDTDYHERDFLRSAVDSMMRRLA